MVKFLKKRKYFKQVKYLNLWTVCLNLTYKPSTKKELKLFKKDLKLLKKYLGKYTSEKVGVCKYLKDYTFSAEFPKSVEDFNEYFHYTWTVLYHWGSTTPLEKSVAVVASKLKIIAFGNDYYQNDFNTTSNIVDHLRLFTQSSDFFDKFPDIMEDVLEECASCGHERHVITLVDLSELNSECSHCGGILLKIKNKKLINKIINGFKNYLVEYQNA